jgi:hypothetical protein
MAVTSLYQRWGKQQLKAIQKINMQNIKINKIKTKPINGNQ